MPVALAGKIMFFSGEFGGSDGRRPIDAKTQTPNEDYVLCDGIETNGIPVPDLRAHMIMCAHKKAYPVGSTGGSETHAHSLSGTVGDCTLTVQQMPEHGHTYTFHARTRDCGYSSGAPQFWEGHGTVGTGNSGGSQSHTHTIEDVVSVESSLPPYYALAAIMYIGD